MAFISFPQLKLDTTKPYLKEKGYWFYLSNKEVGAKNISIPIRPAAVWVNRFLLIFGLLIFPFFILFLYNLSFRHFVRDNQLLILGCYLVPFLLVRLALIGKIYDPRYKDYKAVNKGKRDGLYTSDQSIYTTKQEGIYLCETCSTPIALTDDKEYIKDNIIYIKKLIDGGNGLDIKDGNIKCQVCQSELGRMTEQGAELNGEKLVLDSGELHYIYPNSEA